MSNTDAKDVLERAVSKAIDGGWSMPGRDMQHPTIVDDLSMEGVDKCYIFNHDFAKALWGEEEEPTGYLYPTNDEAEVLLPNWQYHLQQLVIAPDPIAYLGENIDG